MAKKQLTIEEKLQAALVPAEEQPYKVPENWCWVRLDKVYQVNPKNEDVDEDTRAAFIPMANIDGGLTSNFTYEIQSWKQAKKGHTQMADGDVAFAKISPCFENRKSMIVEGLENGIGGGTTELIILRQPNVNKEYTFWLVSTEEFISKGCTTYSGTVGQQRISMDFVKNYPVPLAPLNEQSRIVARIESLFAKLDEAKAKIQEVLDGADLRRAAILHQAFTGKLTEKWRKENSVDDESWKEKLFADFCETQYGYTESATNDPIGPKFLRITDIQDNQVEWNKVPYCKITNDDFEKYRLSYGDIVVARTGATTGKSFLIEDVTDAVFASYLIGIKIKEKSKVMPHFVYKFMQSSFYWQQITDFKIGIAQPGVNAKKIKALRIKIPQIEEQQEIVRLLDNLLSCEQSIVTACEEALTTIDNLKKSILARAFRGELGTNDPTESSAKELLQEILAS